MCMMGRPVAGPTLPPEPAATKMPSASVVRDATGTRTTDAIRSQTATVLTSPKGVLDFAETSKKTLLGQ